MISRVSKIGFFIFIKMAEEDKRIFLAMDEVTGQRQQDGKTNGKHGDMDPLDEEEGLHGRQPNDPQNMLLKDAFSDRKNLARGLCDASLIAANISQLRMVLDSDSDNKFYIPLLTLIGLSLFLHIVFGITIVQMWRVQRKSEIQHLSNALKTTPTPPPTPPPTPTTTKTVTPPPTPTTTKTVTPPNKSENQNKGRSLETIVPDRIPCINKTCTHCRRYQTYDDLSILVVFFLVVLNVAISGIGLPTISKDC